MLAVDQLQRSPNNASHAVFSLKVVAFHLFFMLKTF